MDTLESILGESVEEREHADIYVKKAIPVEIDEGTLLTSDPNEVDIQELRSDKESYLQTLARGNIQLLYNGIWQLPTKLVDGITVAVLPKPKFVLPRSMPVPKPKELTKWEKFAKEKGINKNKKDKLEWDDILKRWIPLHGYKKAQAEKDKSWIVEVTDNANPFEDQFEKMKADKTERVAKNEFQRLRNLAKAKKVKVPKAGFIPTAKAKPADLDAAITVAKSSTASLGKFQPRLPRETRAKNVKDLVPGDRKRKRPMVTPDAEKKRSVEMVDKILNKKPKLNVEKAAEAKMKADNKKENEKKQKSQKAKKSTGRKTKKGAKGGKFRTPKPAKGPVGNTKTKQRPRKGGKVKGGRKRR